MATASNSCPICKLPDCKARLAENSEFDCRRCGKFLISNTLIAIINRDPQDSRNQQLLPFLSSYIRQANQQGIVPQLHTLNWKELAKTHSTTPVSRKVMKLLEVAANRSTHPGDQVKINAELDYPLVDARSSEELSFLFTYLINLEYLERAGGLYRVAVKGWERLEPPTRGGIPGRCFIAMSFDSSLDDAYQNGIYSAVKDCGFEPIRIDLVEHNEKICDKILAEIRFCQFMVADFSLQRAGVYFEAGFASGLGRAVIWTCRKDDFENTHFDTRQYNHIVWDTPEELKAKLADRIRATISQ